MGQLLDQIGAKKLTSILDLIHLMTKQSIAVSFACCNFASISVVGLNDQYFPFPNNVVCYVGLEKYCILDRDIEYVMTLRIKQLLHLNTS